jgi:hypothetical protein
MKIELAHKYEPVKAAIVELIAMIITKISRYLYLKIYSIKYIKLKFN